MLSGLSGVNLIMQAEDLLPQELRNKAVRSGEWGWRFEDVPLVIKACQDL